MHFGNSYKPFDLSIIILLGNVDCLQEFSVSIALSENSNFFLDSFTNFFPSEFCIRFSKWSSHEIENCDLSFKAREKVHYRISSLFGRKVDVSTKIQPERQQQTGNRTFPSRTTFTFQDQVSDALSRPNPFLNISILHSGRYSFKTDTRLCCSKVTLYFCFVNELILNSISLILFGICNWFVTQDEWYKIIGRFGKKSVFYNIFHLRRRIPLF